MSKQGPKGPHKKLAPDSKWNVFSRPVHRNRPRAEVISFDEDSRKEFLGGFRKRKNQRREIAKTQAQKIVMEQKREEKEERRKQIAGYMQKLIDAKDQANEGGEAFLLDAVEEGDEKSKKRPRADDDSDSEDEDDNEKIYETDTQKITAIVEDGEDQDSSSESDEFAGMPALQPVDPPKKPFGGRQSQQQHHGKHRGGAGNRPDRPSVPKGSFEVVKQSHPRHPWQKKKHLGGGNKKRKLA
eukprot:TRINITY_DN13756_c0_g1_i1.p1 TRINITY_DN13756_c0_g1~~TRINITY_DN13756_c0_g1_i1.p1  ORF type:complete len:241 (+),score=51.27 TRINITY_DN13756_c0_g1_i1:26-748(+)